MALATAGLIFAIVLSRGSWLPLPAKWLVNEDGKAAPGWVIALMGDGSEFRISKALSLLRHQNAEKIVISETLVKEFDLKNGCLPPVVTYLNYLTEKDVAPSDIIVTKCAVSSTQEEADCLLKTIKETSPPPTQITIVTSWFHTSRALWIYQRTFKGTGVAVQTVAAQTPEGSAENWWRYESTFLDVFLEYLKWTYWRLGIRDWVNSVPS